MEKIKMYRKRTAKWDTASEYALLEVWGEKMEPLHASRRNFHILEEMAKKLKNRGYAYSALELKTKMHNMTSRYRKEKLRIQNGFPSDWDLYEQVDILFTQFKKENTESTTLDSINSINLDSVSDPLSQHSYLASSPTPTCKRSSSPDLASSVASSPSSTTNTTNKIDLEELFKKVLRNMEEIQYDIKTMSERMIAIEEKKVRILKAYVEKEAEVQKALVKFFKKN